MALLNIFTFIGIIAAAISGALLGVKKHMDFFGIIILGIAAALGGGIVRDILIGSFPPVALKMPSYTIASTVAAILVMFFTKRFLNLTKIIIFFDALGLGVFTAVGTNIALEQPVTSTFMAVAIGVTAGIGGGIIRDILAQEIPLIFQKEVYATASIIGAITLVYSRYLVGGMVPLYICFFTTVAIRLISLYFGINEQGRITKELEETALKKAGV
jgi:uncharacterized membrane protein YeiH